MTSLIREWEGSLLKFGSFFMSDFPWRACTTFRHAPLHVFRSLSQTTFLLSPSVSVPVSFLCDSRAAGSLSRGFYRFFHWRRLNGRNICDMMSQVRLFLRRWYSFAIYFLPFKMFQIERGKIWQHIWEVILGKKCRRGR